MTFDWTDFADALHILLLLAGAAWLFLAWRNRLSYRLALAVMLALYVLDWIAGALARWATAPDSGVPTDVPQFSVFILLGAMLGLGAAAWQWRRSGLPTTSLIDAALLSVIVGAVAARGYHVLAHWDYYTQNPDNIMNLEQGGMGLRGGIAAGLLVLLAFSLWRRVSFWRLADAASIGLALALVPGWYAANLIGLNYGRVWDSAYAPELPDLYGLIAPRYPVQITAMLFFAAATLLLVYLAFRRGAPGGALFVAFLILFGLGNLLFDFLRADETLLSNGLRVDTWVDILISILGLILLAGQVASFAVRPNPPAEARA